MIYHYHPNWVNIIILYPNIFMKKLIFGMLIEVCAILLGWILFLITLGIFFLFKKLNLFIWQKQLSRELGLRDF